MAEAKNADRALPLLEKLAKIRKLVDVVSKDKKGFNYKYSDINEILAKLKAGMERYGVTLIPQIIHGTTEVAPVTLTNVTADGTGKRVEKSTTEISVKSDMVFRWINDDNPNEFIDVPWYLVGSQTDQSQAFGSALTYCTRYFLLNYFQIAQDNDVDEFRSKQKEAAHAEETATAAEIVAKITEEMRAYLADHDEQKTAVKKLCEKYAKGGNYTTIKEPAIAAKLLDEFRTKFAAAAESEDAASKESAKAKK